MKKRSLVIAGLLSLLCGFIVSMSLMAAVVPPGPVASLATGFGYTCVPVFSPSIGHDATGVGANIQIDCGNRTSTNACGGPYALWLKLYMWNQSLLRWDFQGYTCIDVAQLNCGVVQVFVADPLTYTGVSGSSYMAEVTLNYGACGDYGSVVIDSSGNPVDYTQAWTLP